MSETRKLLKTETNTPQMHARIVRAAHKRFGKPCPGTPSRGTFNTFFEHGQWWVIDALTGAIWSVVDAEGVETIDGFDCEQVAEGDER